MKKSTQYLLETLGTCVKTDRSSLYRSSFDGMKRSFLPDALILARTEKHVEQTLLLANKYKVPVITRGAGSNLTGAATPVKGGWVLDLSRMKKLKVDAQNRMVTAQAGVVLADLQAKVAEEGLYYPPDPSSIKWCTIGGNVACNAGGLHCVKYGVTRDYVLSIKGFLPTGEKVEWATKTRKFATAYNIRDLWIGSEGTLGVITEVTLRLIPKPPKRWALLAIFKKEEDALQAVFPLLQSGVQPAVMEFLDIESVVGAERATKKSLFPGKPGRSVLLIEIDGNPSSINGEKKLLQAWAKTYAEDFRTAQTEEKIEELWQVRRTCSSAMFELGNSKLNEDVVVPLSKQVQLVKEIAKIRKIAQVPIAVFGHAGDGNLHVNIMYDREDHQQTLRAEKAVDRLMRVVVKLGGAISGEHGVGLAKTPFLRYQFTEVEIKTMQAIKKTFDPKDILNPHKIFTPFEMWKHTPEEVKLPWDHR